MNKWIYYIFEHWNERRQFCVGLGAIVLGSLFLFWTDMRLWMFNLTPFAFQSLYVPFLDSLINVMTLSGILYLMALFVNKRTRWIDVLNAVMLSRIALYFVSLFNINGFLTRFTSSVTKGAPGVDPFMGSINMALILLFVMVVILLLVLSIWLLLAGFRTASNARSTKGTALFVLGLFMATIFSELLIQLLHIHYNY